MENKMTIKRSEKTLIVAVTFLALLVLFSLNINFVSAELNYTTGEAVYTNYNWNETHINDNFTMSAWVYAKDSGTMPVIYKPFSYSLLINSNNKTELKLNNGTNFASSGNVELNNWTFFAVYYNG